MLSSQNKGRVIFLAVSLFLSIYGITAAEEAVVELNFDNPKVSESDTSRTLQSLVKVQGTGQFCQDGLYLMTHFGDREEIFQKENHGLIEIPFLDQTWRHCSVFSTTAGNSLITGGNWDNQNVGSIIVVLYHPPQGYSSISFCRSIDLGFGNKDLEQYKSGIFAGKLLLAPFYAMDGINEHGPTVAVAAANLTTHEPKADKQLVFAYLLVHDHGTVFHGLSRLEQDISFEDALTRLS
ncbi:MAG: hypothetical protein JXB45_04065 [Candidatus Krumholzibacteriota bacterium]|nr:hypothetical protein [Candidatus Krumholzibacteriota bacterium]